MVANSSNPWIFYLVRDTNYIPSATNSTHQGMCASILQTFENTQYCNPVGFVPNIQCANLKQDFKNSGCFQLCAAHSERRKGQKERKSRWTESDNLGMPIVNRHRRKTSILYFSWIDGQFLNDAHNRQCHKLTMTRVNLWSVVNRKDE